MLLILKYYLTQEQFEEDQSHISLPKVPVILINSQSFPNVKTRPKLLSQRTVLSTIGGSIDLDNELLTEKIRKSKPQSSTNELPLTELNLEIFTSNRNDNSNSKMSTNELPLSDIMFRPRRNTFYAKVNSDFDNSNKRELSKYKQRSFSDPNILDSEHICCSDRLHWLKKNSEASVVNADYSSDVDEDSLLVCFCENSLWFRRAPSTLLSFLTSPPNSMYPKQIRSTSQPSSPCVTSNPCMSYTESNSSSEKRHRHGIAGQMNYYRVIQTPIFGWDCPFSFKRTTLGSTNSLFSTAVISGSSSAPNLRDMIPSATSVSEGFGGVPPIRPLETLHNALSLRQIDAFLDCMTKASLFKTPSSTPPKYPSTPLPTPVGSQSTSTTLSSLGEQPLKSPCNSGVWSGPPSYISSSGQSSPGLSETNSKESSDLSSSAISYDGYLKH